MVDIIIPAYNAKSTIRRALYSISIQRKVKKFHVYLINDCSDYDYHEEVNFFSNYFDITELKTSSNSGPGVARQLGIDNSSSKYIMFIDSDDYLYSPYSLYNLYSEIVKSRKDFLVSNFIMEKDHKNIVKKNDVVWLHGKIYRRSFLEKNNIHFNNTRANEDNGFNRLVVINKPKTIYLNIITYVYSNNKSSITRSNDNLFRFTGLEWYCYNVIWALKEVEDNKACHEDICHTSLGVLISMYYYYLELYGRYDVSKIIEWSVSARKLFNKYKDKYYDKYIEKKLFEEKEFDYKNNDFNINKIINFDEYLLKVDELIND